MKKNIYLALAAVALLASCNEEDMNIRTQGGEVQFTAGMPQTRAVDDAWQMDDPIGIFAYDGEGTVENGYNEPYRITNPSTGAMSPATPANKIIYPLDGSKHSYYAYYPHSATAVSGTTYTVDATDQSNEEKIKACDLMWASAESQNTATVSLPFAHRMVKLTFTIQAGGVEVTDLTGITATLQGVNATATFNLLTGTFNFSFPRNIELFAMPNGEGNTQAIIEAFVVPTSNLGDVKLSLNIGGTQFVWSPAAVSSINEWEGGQSYAYTITAGKVPSPATIGDYYYKDGTVSSTYTASTSNPCIGIVFWIGDPTANDAALKAAHPGCTHGLVVALNDVSADIIPWQYSYYDNSINSWGTANTNYDPIISGTDANGPINIIRGYNNTKVIEAFNAANAHYPVEAVQLVVAYRTTVPTLANNSGWYLPSLKELALLCGTANPTDNVYDNKFGTDNYDRINGKLQTASGGEIKQIGYYWSSTEYSIAYNYAWTFNFYGGGTSYTIKKSGYWVRAVLAF